MKNIFKKLICTSLTFMFAVSSFSVSGANVGDKIDEVLSTDIVTFVEGLKVPSFNIAGRTAIVVENLNAKTLPFDVYYDDSTRTLSVTDGRGGAKDYFLFESNDFFAPIGTPVMDVLFTDIETFYSGKKLESFNIGGFTCIYATDFAQLYGRYTWNEETRTVDIFRNKEEASGRSFSEDAEAKLPAKESVVERGDTTIRWGSPGTSYLIQGPEETYYTIDFSGTVNIEKYDSDFKYISSSKIKPELPIFGGFLEGEEYNYIAFGQANEKHSDSLPIIKIVAYDKEFKKVKDITINDCKTSIPFDACNVSMTENDDYLILHTARSQYEENGMRPQTQLTVIIDKESWSVVNSLDKFQPNHTSHALMGFVRTDGGKIVTANYSDATPVRGAFLQKLDFDGKLLTTKTIFKAGGPDTANCTGAMLGGFEISNNSYIFALSSIDHTLPTDYSDTGIDGIDKEERDIYIVTTDKNGDNLTAECLTYYSGLDKSGSVPYLVPLENGNFMVLWQKFKGRENQSNTFCYALLDRRGKLIGEVKQAEGHLSDSCQPIEVDGMVTWYVNTSSGRTFYMVDSRVR